MPSRHSATARARSTCWPGPAMRRTGPPTRPSTGSPASRRRPAARSTSRRSAPPTRPSSSSSPASTTRCRPRVTRRCRLIAAGEVAPVNFDLIPNYADIFPDLKLQPWNSVNGVGYGVPHGRGANLLMYDTEGGHARSRLVERGLRRRERLRREGDGLRLADLHRGRRALPDGDPARPRASRTRTPSTRPSWPPPSSCSRRRRRTSASTGATTSSRSRRSSPATPSSGPRGRSSSTWPWAKARPSPA